MNNTNCETCLFAHPYNDDYSACCEFKIPKLVKDSKEIELSESKYLRIKNYLCKYGFSQQIYDLNKDDLLDINIKDQVINRLILKYYLIIDCRDPECDPELVVTNLNISAKYPKFVSIVVNNDIEAKKYISLLDSIEDRPFSYKIHVLLEDRQIQNILSIILDTNTKKNNTQFFWIVEPKNLTNLKTHIDNIQSILQLHQPDCDFITMKDKSVSDIFGLFLPFEYYTFLKDKYGSLKNATQDETLRIVYYE